MELSIKNDDGEEVVKAFGFTEYDYERTLDGDVIRIRFPKGEENMIPSWLYNAIKNYDFRLRLPEKDQKRLDELILELRDYDKNADSPTRDRLQKEIEEILNTGVERAPAGKAVADAAKAGFESARKM